MSPDPTSTVFFHGSVYSPVDPFASAIQVSGATVAWLGSDEAARALAGEAAAVRDVHGAVITPAFVAHRNLDGDAPEVGPGQGYGAVELLGSDAAALHAQAERARQAGLTPLPVLLRAVREAAEIPALGTNRPCLGFDAAAAGPDAGLEAALTSHFAACTEVGYQAVVVCAGPDEDARPGLVATVLDAADVAAQRLGERAFRSRRHRLVGVGELSAEHCDRLADHALTVSLRPGAAPVRELSRAGAAFTLLTNAANPWRTAKEVVEAPEAGRRSSARAAFLALTRGVWRAQPDASPLAGQLAPGTEASLALWDAQSLMVQQAQGTGASWSTDARARTPVLPALDDPALPECELTMVAGTAVFERLTNPDLGAAHGGRLD